MRTRRLASLLICFVLFSPTADAQFLKKLTKKAEDAAERTFNKKDQADSTKTGEVTDQTESGGDNQSGTSGQETPDTNAPETPSSEKEKAKMAKMATMFGGGLEDVPDRYVFSYVVTYRISTDKEELPFSYFLQPGAGYLGNNSEDPRGNSFLVYDFEKKFMITFMDNGQDKMAMKMKMPNMKKMQQRYGEQLLESQDEDAQITPIEGKNILGYDCLGYKIVNKEGESKIWFTNEAPVSPNAVFAKITTMPETGPYANVPYSEKSLVMEMEFQSSKKRNDTMHMVITELAERPVVIEKKDYKTGM